MRSVLFSLSVSITLLTTISFTCKKKTVKVKGSITSTSSHCGGMRPTEEMEKTLNTPRPLSGKTIYFREGKINDFDKPVVATATSDHAGSFEVKLKPGFYAVVDERKKDKTFYNEWLKTYAVGNDNYDPIDKACLDKWMMTPDRIIEVKEDQFNEFSINFHQPCSWGKIPCANYIGPLPP